MDLSTKRIAVTGGAGFLGSFVVDKLRHQGVKEIDIPRSASCDLVDVQAVRSWMAETKPHVIFHLAARVGGIGANQKNPGKYFHDNLLMGVNVLEQSRHFGVEKVIMVGTICAYPKFAPIPFKEEDLWNGYPEETNAPYGIAKKSLITMAQAYREQYGLNAICLLPVNLYGPRDNFDLETSHVIPAMIRKCVDAQQTRQDSITLWGDGSPTREFLYVEDCADGLIAAAEKYEDSQPVNLGAGFEISMRDLANKVRKLVGFDGSLVWDKNRPNGQPRRMLDVSKARKLFGFEAQTSFDDGLQKTVQWYRNNADSIR